MVCPLPWECQSGGQPLGTSPSHDTPVPLKLLGTPGTMLIFVLAVSKVELESRSQLGSLSQQHSPPPGQSLLFSVLTDF